MAFPNLFEVMMNVVRLVVGLPLIYLLSKVLKVRSKPIAISNARREVVLASLMMIVAFIILFIYRTLLHASQLDLPRPIDLTDLLTMWAVYAPVFLALAVVMKRSGQNLESIGITRKDGGRMLGLGLAASVIYVTISGLLAPSFGGVFAGFSPSLAYGLVFFTAVGFSEEIVWRGYVQTRLTAYSGKLRGLIVASLLFAVVWHFPRAYYIETSGVVLEALAWAMARVFASLLFGYLMLKSQNIIPSSILHLFWDWNVLLWQFSF